MTREQAKELLPLIKAFAEGKTIEERDPHGNWKEAKNPIFTDSLIYSCVEYRIKPEPKYRPFKSKEECWQEMQKHQPVGFLKSKDNEYFYLIGSVNKDNTITLAIEPNTDYSYIYLFEHYIFSDGMPFGIKE